MTQPATTSTKPMAGTEVKDAIDHLRSSAQELHRAIAGLWRRGICYNRSIMKGYFMKRLSLIIGISAALAASGASAQSINLTGVFRCVQMCRGASPAYVTQNGPELNLLTEAGVPSRAWPD